MQNDIVARLSKTDLATSKYDWLSKCSRTRCGSPKGCVGVCVFGNERRRKEASAAILDLFGEKKDLWHVRVSRTSWNRPFGSLRDTSILAPVQLNRRALDKLGNHMLAVGSVKVYPDSATQVWRCEIDEIVAGAPQDEIERAFVTSRTRLPPDAYTYVRPVKDSKSQLRGVLTQNLEEWCWPGDPRERVRAKKAQRSEYYRWVLGLGLNDRVVRYGCDRYFNPLTKPAKITRPPKKRPYPWHLQRHMFGNHPNRCDCGACGGLSKRERNQQDHYRIRDL